MMKAFKEYRIFTEASFPVDVFISDNMKQNIKVPPHWHDYIELLYMLEGTALQQVNGKYFNIQKNDIIILNSGDIHTTDCTPDENVKILVIQFYPDFINTRYSNITESKYILAFLNNGNNYNYHIADTQKNSREIFELMVGIYNEFLNKSAGYEIFIKGYIYQLIATLLRNDILNMYKPDLQEEKLKRLEPLIKYIESHYTENIDLRKAAGMLNFSYYYFSRYFKNITGKSYKEYIDYIRVCEAEKLLISQDKSIAEVALEAGFSNVSSFNRVFKRVRNYAPSILKKTKTAKK